MNNDAAKKFADEMIAIMHQLSESAGSLKDACDAEEF